MKNMRLTADKHATVLEMFEMGHSQPGIATALNVPLGNVKQLIKQKYLMFEGRKFLPAKEIATKYKGGSSLYVLAETYDTTVVSIKSILESYGLEVADVAAGEHNFNESYFDSIDTPEKAYWLGFFFAGGYVSGTRTDVSLTLGRSDRSHLEKFLHNIDYCGSGAINDDESGNHSINVRWSKLSLKSEQMWCGLVDKGCIPRQSSDVRPPMSLPIQLHIDFIRGVVDGGGKVSGVGFPSLEIVGSYHLLTWIAEILVVDTPQPYRSAWRVRTSGRSAVDAMSKLYYDGCVSLDRKLSNAQYNMKASK